MARLVAVVVLEIVLGASGLAAVAATEAQDPRPARQAWFHEAKYGLFINWGLYSIPAGEWKGKPVPGIGEWIMYKARIPVKEYEQLAARFNPTKFNAEEWAQLAEDAGMKYVVFDCKHHDGFAMYRSKVSKYNVCDATPFKRDPMKELAEACKRHKLKLCFYYSQATDWHEPNGANNDWDFAPNAQKDFDQYLRDKSLPQVRELLSNYGPIGLIWFDVPTLMNPERCKRFTDLVRSIQPNTLVNSRLGLGAEFDYRSMGDNQIPNTVLTGAWETAATINDTWGYKKDDHNWKSPSDVAFKLVDIVSKGGNYLLNVGPTADGVIPPPSQNVLRRVGRWLAVNGEAVYGAGPTPFGGELGSPIPGQKDQRGQPAYHVAKDWRATTKPGKLYLHFFTWPKGPFELKGLTDKVVKAYWLADPDRKPVAVSQTDGKLSITMPEKALDEIATVLCLELGDWDMLTARPEDVRQWQDMRFGMFVCWGPVTLTGREIGWSRGAPRGGDPSVHPGQGETPAEIYDNLYKKWKPDKFDAREWVAVAREAGAKYMIFLVKHHDGYCLYDTRLTDYRSTSPKAAWRHDVMADIAEACHEAGLKLIVYYSQPDWYHPDYRTKNHERYIKFFHGQIQELLTNYGRIDGFWFDLGGKPEDWDSEKLFKMMRSRQPWLVINNRCGLRGDYDTPEQKLGQFQLDRPWETCMTLGTQWSWKPDDQIKSLKQCVDVLVTCAGRNGNLALNTNPMPDGRIEPRQVERFRELGRWLAKNGRSVYGTRGGPFWGLNCLSTRKGDTIYVHVLKWYDDVLLLPPLSKKVLSHALLTGGTAEVAQTEQGIEIRVPAEHRDALDTIVALRLDGPAGDLEPARVDWGPLTFARPVKASHTFDRDPKNAWRYAPEKAVDGDPATGWTMNPDVRSAWLEVDLQREVTFDRAYIDEPLGRVREFRLEVQEGGAWKPFYRGGRIGGDHEAVFPAVRGRRVRLCVGQSTANPLIREFHLLRARAVKPQGKTSIAPER